MKDPIPKGRIFNALLFRANFANGLKNPLRTNRNISPALAFPDMYLDSEALNLPILALLTFLDPVAE